MIASLGPIWSTLLQPATRGLKPEEWAVLALLASSLLVLAIFRERYLGFWAAGWALLASSRLFASQGVSLQVPARFVVPAEQAAFVLATGLFCGAVFAYIRERNLIWPLVAVTASVTGFAVTRAFLWSDSVPLRFALEISYRIILLTAALALLNARRGRREFTSWLPAGLLLTLHLEWTPVTSQVPAGFFLAAEVALGLVALLTVIQEGRARSQRLSVMRALTESVMLAQQQGGMMDKTLEELRELTQSNAAWFRLIESGKLVATHGVGVSPDFLREVGIAELDENASQLLHEGKPKAVRRVDAKIDDEALLKSEKLRYLLMVPVAGKKGPVGLITLASPRQRKLTSDELDFLETCGRQLGIAIENFRLLEQVLRSQRQWRNTFDSIHDIILAHDAEFRVIKANQILLEQLQRSSGEVIGSSCESVLPHALTEWKGCPYCLAATRK